MDTFSFKPRSALRTAVLAIGLVAEPGLAAGAQEGTVAAASDGGGARITGSVFDSTTMSYLAGARVAVLGTNAVATSSEDGSFLLSNVPAGSHWVLFYHERLGELGVSAPSRQLTLREGNSDEVLLAIPSRTTLLGAWCMAEERRPGAAAISGTVTDSLTGVPIPGAVVTASPPRRGGVGGDPVSVRTDDSGRYRMCDAPASEFTLQASFAQSRGRSVFLGLEPGAAAVVDLMMLLAAEATLRGNVIDPLSGEPVANATVQVLGTDASVLTNAAGDFLLDKLPPGRHLVVTDHIAYEQRTDSVTIQGQETVDIEVRLAQEVIELEGFVVTGRSRFGRSSLAGDAKRADFLDRESIEELLVRSTNTVDLLRNMNTPGLRVRDVWVEGPLGIRMQGYCIEVSRRSGGQGCQPAAVFLNDVLVPFPDELIRDLNPQAIQGLEVLSPIDAQFQFGTIAGNGAILIYTTAR